METILNAEMRQVLGDVNSSALLSSDRVDLMNQIRDLARAKASAFGVEIVDVRIKRADLPIQNLEKTFERMRADANAKRRMKIARGNESSPTRPVQLPIGGCGRKVSGGRNKTAEIIREGGCDPALLSMRRRSVRIREFFAFYRSLSAYRKALKGG